MSKQLTERWYNIYEDGYISIWFGSKEDADVPCGNGGVKRTHYLKTYWNEEGVMQDIELIKIEE